MITGRTPHTRRSRGNSHGFARDVARQPTAQWAAGEGVVVEEGALDPEDAVGCTRIDFAASVPPFWLYRTFTDCPRASWLRGADWPFCQTVVDFTSTPKGTSLPSAVFTFTLGVDDCRSIAERVPMMVGMAGLADDVGCAEVAVFGATVVGLAGRAFESEACAEATQQHTNPVTTPIIFSRCIVKSSVGLRIAGLRDTSQSQRPYQMNRCHRAKDGGARGESNRITRAIRGVTSGGSR